MSPNKFETSVPDPEAESRQGLEVTVVDARHAELSSQRIARIDGHAVPLVDRVHDETQRTDPESGEKGTRYSRHPHIRDWLDRLGPRHKASKK